MSACSKGCGMAVVFVTMTATRKLMPVDPVPDDLGNVYARMIGGRLAGHVRTKDEQCPDGWQIYMPHWRTCSVALHLNKFETGARGAPGPKTQPSLFDSTPETPVAPATGQQEGTTP